MKDLFVKHPVLTIGDVLVPCESARIIDEPAYVYSDSGIDYEQCGGVSVILVLRPKSIAYSFSNMNGQHSPYLALAMDDNANPAQESK